MSFIKKVFRPDTLLKGTTGQEGSDNNFTLRNFLNPAHSPFIGGTLAKLDPAGAALSTEVENYVAPKWKDYSTRTYVDPFTGKTVRYKSGGKVKRYSKGGDVDDLAPRENLPKKNATEQVRENKKVKPKRENDLTPYENLPPKKYAKGGTVRGDGCASRGKTKGRMR